MCGLWNGTLLAGHCAPQSHELGGAVPESRTGILLCGGAAPETTCHDTQPSECANLLAAGYRPEAIARCLRPPTGADSTESIHSIFCKRSNKALRQNCCAFPACLTNVACECRMREAVTLHQLDDVVTGSLHGFPGANDYRLRASSKP